MANDLRDDVSRGAWILQQIEADRAGQERNAARRLFADVVKSWPGPAEELWWRWIAEAGISEGLRARTIDCSLDEALRLARDGAQMIWYDGPVRRWSAVTGTAGRHFLVAQADSEAQTRRVSRRGLRQLLEDAADDGTLRCVVMMPHQSPASAERDERPVGPFDRLRRILRPERSDLAIVIVFAFVVGLLTLATPIAVETLVNTVAFGRFLQPIILLALILLTFLGFQAAVRALQTYVVEIIQRRMFARVAADLADRLPRVQIEATDNQYVPELVNRFFDVVTVQKVTAQLLLDGVGLVLGTVIGMAVLGFYHPWLLGFDVLLLASIAFIIFVLGRGAVASSVKESKNKYYMAAWLEDIARCPTAFRTEGGADFALERADVLIHNYLSARRSHFRILMRQILFALGLQAVASTVLLGLGGWLVVAGELTLGQLVAAELIVTVIVGAFAKFGKHMESFYDLLASVDKLGVLIDLPVEPRAGIVLGDEERPLELDLQSVSYKRIGQSFGLDSITVSVPAGSGLAVIGPAGSGKSSLLDIMAGFRSPTAGHLTLDGLDPRDLRPDSLQHAVALVRGTEVFHASLEENVHLHRPGISAATVRRLLHQVGLFDAVVKLDDGCDTDLASGGAPLSESQQLLLNIARAAAGRPGLLLIDGALDGLPDQQLEQALDFLLQPERPWTLVVATGRDLIADRLPSTLVLGRAPALELGGGEA